MARTQSELATTAHDISRIEAELGRRMLEAMATLPLGSQAEFLANPQGVRPRRELQTSCNIP